MPAGRDGGAPRPYDGVVACALQTYRQGGESGGDEHKAHVEEEKVDERKRQAAVVLAVVYRLHERVELEVEQLLDEKVDEEGRLVGGLGQDAKVSGVRGGRGGAAAQLPNKRAPWR